MSGRIKNRKSNVAMLEFVCTLGILLIVSVFLLRLFLGANSLETKARDISKATILAESMAETIKGYPSMEEAIKELKLIQIQDNFSTAIYEKYYDSSWEPVRTPEAYRVIITAEQQEYASSDMYLVQIVVKNETSYPIIKEDESNELVSLEVYSYKQKEK